MIREHPQDQNVLFAGAEFGAFYSLDRGASWRRIKMNFPTVPVDDIQIQPRENDLILGTHGRSIWILDDIAPLLQFNDQLLSHDLHLFPIRPAIAWRMYSNKWYTGNQHFIGPNPPDGALITYYLKSKPDEKEKVKITILDKDGKTVRELDGEKNAGINRVNWDLRYNAPRGNDRRTARSPGAGIFRRWYARPARRARRLHRKSFSWQNGNDAIRKDRR